MQTTSDRIRPADRTSSASCPRPVNVDVVVDRAGGARPPWFIALAVVSLRSFVKVQGGACVGVRSPMCCFGWGKDTKMGVARGGGRSDILMDGSSLQWKATRTSDAAKEYRTNSPFLQFQSQCDVHPRFFLVIIRMERFPRTRRGRSRRLSR